MNAAPVLRTYLGMPVLICGEAMEEVFARAERVARTSASVLVEGESGSGKELVARAIHFHSDRRARPWVDVSCAALPESLIESELFGHERGAFSGAEAAKPGLFELAHSGTLFLDEIGELDARLQVKLLRVLDGAPYYRLGGTRKVFVDVRIVAATNRDLAEAAQQGRFRRDLYHRLGQVSIRVPPLRQRAEEIVPLAEYFLRQHNPVLRFSPAARGAMERYAWPGNVRELRNAVLKSAIFAEGGCVEAADLPEEVLRAHAGAWRDEDAADPSLDRLERRLILSTLESTGGHRQRTAELLGISRRTLTRKLKLYQSDTMSAGCVS